MTSQGKDFTHNNNSLVVNDVCKLWNEKVKTTLDMYMTIPNVSSAYDADWIRSGHIERVVELYSQWARDNSPRTALITVQRIENKTPLIVVDIPARDYTGDDAVLLYGHLDKQPAMTGWRDGLEPFAAHYEGDRLFGRGGMTMDMHFFCDACV